VELAESGATTIVTLGNTATQAILQTKQGITSLRTGAPKSSPLFPEARIIPTFHPAACLRSGDYFPYLVRDVGKVNQGAEEFWVEPSWTLADDEDSVFEALEMVRDQAEWLVVDIEVGIDRDTYFGHAERYEWLCVGLSWAPDKALIIGEEALRSAEVRKDLLETLRQKRLIAHNTKFDNAGLGGGLPFEFDTMLASYCLDERPGTNSLDYCATEELGSPPWKHEIDRYKPRMSRMPLFHALFFISTVPTTPQPSSNCSTSTVPSSQSKGLPLFMIGWYTTTN